MTFLSSNVRFGVASTAYGIGFNITGFGVNVYLTQFIYAAVELPTKLSVYYLLEKFGRRKTEAGSILLTGVCLGINIFISKGKIFRFFCVHNRSLSNVHLHISGFAFIV